jgi:hypothetical protein
VIAALAVFRDARAIDPLLRLLPTRAFQGQLQHSVAEGLLRIDPKASTKAISKVHGRAFLEGGNVPDPMLTTVYSNED